MTECSIAGAVKGKMCHNVQLEIKALWCYRDNKACKSCSPDVRDHACFNNITTELQY